MWLAKPLLSLNPTEQAQWCEVLARAQSEGREAPLAQTLAWGRAIHAVGGRAYVVFSPDEKVGGLVFSSSSNLECTNGPLLDWDDVEKSARQLATFASAVARLAPGIQSLTLRPRWFKGEVEKRLAHLPIPAHSRSQAKTLKISFDPDQSPEEQFTDRLKRTLKNADRAGIVATWEELAPERLVEFALAAQAFGRSRGFSVPPIFWFRALTETESTKETAELAPRFGLVTASDPSGQTGCQLLIARHAGESHYLFGHEWRSDATPASLSPAAAAQRLAINRAWRDGMSGYDFNGYLDNASADHPYAGVSRFKAQFGGELVHYEVPEFVITLN